VTAPVFRRGDIHIGDLDPQKGSEQGGRRPVLVFQADTINAHGNTVVVIPLTTNLSSARLPSRVYIPAGTGGLNKDTVAMCDQIRVLDKRWIGQRVATLPPDVMQQIEDTLLLTLGVAEP
jgi:mRNA interferase MazF